MVSTGGPFNEQFSIRRSVRRGGKQIHRKRSFTDEFKQSAVRLVVAEGNRFAPQAKAVNVSEQSLRHWHAKFAPKPTPCGENASLEELKAENKRLTRELRRAELEREILKKATPYFARESQ
ncbi:MAG TPA: transposase [Pirellulales bacterium]|jgi:transposase|nr:transposase [Pirellulales bacterium]